MSKPIEETWRVVAGSSGIRLFTVVSDTYRDGAFQVVCRNLDGREAGLIVAAPEIARALLGLGVMANSFWSQSGIFSAAYHPAPMPVRPSQKQGAL